MKRALVAAAIALGAAEARADDFSFLAPGDLAPGSGKGRVDDTVYAPGIRFPIEDGPAFANSQVWGHGGNSGPGGNQCDKENFSYPWRDNFCETRTWDMPLCPAGVGHQGQDVRAADCVKEKHWAVAVTDGTVTSIGSYTVYVTAADGTRYDYLHEDGVVVTVGQKVKRGDHIGKVSNNFGGSSTTVHLHFNIRQNVMNVGVVFVPPYLSLVQAYKATLAKPASGKVDGADCDTVRGWAFDPAAGDKPIDVEVSVEGGQLGTVAAGKTRQDLCQPLGSCDHAFEAASPLSAFDGKPHTLHFNALSADGTKHELAGSPVKLTCGPIALDGVRRALPGFSAHDAWRLTEFWDAPPGNAATLPLGEPAPAEPKVLGDPASPWLIDGTVKRKVGNPLGWHVDAIGSVPGDVAGFPAAKPLRPRAELVVVGYESFLLDDADGKTVTSPPTGPAPEQQVGATSSCGFSAAPAGRSALALIAAVSLALAGRSRSRSRRNRAR